MVQTPGSVNLIPALTRSHGRRPARGRRLGAELRSESERWVSHGHDRRESVTVRPGLRLCVIVTPTEDSMPQVPLNFRL